MKDVTDDRVAPAPWFLGQLGDQTDDRRADVTTNLEKVDDALWLAEGETVSFYGFPYPTRSVVIRLAGERLWVWSPILLTDELRREVDRLGQVAHLVSPNKLHHLYLAAWKSAFPTARLWGPQSAVARLPSLDFAGAIADTPPGEWGPDFDQARFRGSFMMDEVVFFHRPSRTAIVADLIQALDDAFLRRQWSWWRRPMARLGGISAANPGAPSDWRLSFLDRVPARAARAKALAWECERVVIAHGAWARSGGQDFLRRGLAWLGPGSS